MANEEVDVVVVGAGFGGIHHVFRARQEGLTVVALERWSGFGGFVFFFFFLIEALRIDLFFFDNF